MFRYNTVVMSVDGGKNRMYRIIIYRQSYILIPTPINAQAFLLPSCNACNRPTIHLIRSLCKVRIVHNFVWHISFSYDITELNIF